MTLAPTCLVHWDDVPAVGGAWQALGRAAGSVTVEVNRVRLDPGEVSRPAHVHDADEEIVFLLAGSGLSRQDGTTYAVRAGDVLVHRPGGGAHALRAGDDGLELLVYGRWTELGDPLPPPWLEWPEPAAERPPNLARADELEGDYGGMIKGLGRAAGAQRSGLNLVALPPGEEGSPPHCHSAEEELFVVLAGEGMLELWSRPDPERPLQTEPSERHPVRAGHVVARPAATRVPHSLRAGAGGMTYLAYGTREPNDLCWYPRSNKVFFRGLGVIARLELLGYGDGEPE